MRVPLLPPALLDLISVRASLRANNLHHVPATKCKNTLNGGTQIRQMQQAALATSDSQEYPPDTSQAVQNVFTRRRIRRRRESALSLRPSEGLAVSTSSSELEYKVQTLQNTVVNEETLQNLPGLSEDDLSNIYQDLLALPTIEDVQKSLPDDKLQIEVDQALILAVDQRLHGSTSTSFDDTSSPLSTSMLARQESASFNSLTAEHITDTIEQTLPKTQDTLQSPLPHRRILSRFSLIAERLDAVRSTVAAGTNETGIKEIVPISILSNQEWQSLVRVCLREQDVEAAATAVELMKRSGISVPEASINEVLGSYATQGDIAKAETFITTCFTEMPTATQRDLHVKVHLQATEPKTIPYAALSVLHAYETQGIPAPVKSYTRLITSLFSVQSTIGYAQAWDLFTHMRYVAHPTPDALLYTLMIRACASSLTSSSEPERALDLWTEMTVDHGIQPSSGTYTAIILACARSGSKTYIHEAFRLAKEMLDSHRDASGRSAYKPDGKTFSALLEGAKRIGDLARTRWILAELVRASERDGDNGFVNAEVTEEVMMHVFHAYAAYKPPFKRSAAVLVNGKGAMTHPVEPASSSQEPSLAEALADAKPQENPLVETDTPSFAHLPPQNRSEVVSEARALFSRILEDRNISHNSTYRQFSNVQLTPRLLNSYLSVYYAHASFAESHQLHKTLFEKLTVPRNIHTYVEALEKCATARRGHERPIALSFAEDLWSQWQAIETGEKSEVTGKVSARMIERANVAMIRVWTLTGKLDLAVNQVKEFAHRYSPSSTRQPAPKLPLRSTRTVLVGQRPLVRMTSTVDLPDDTVPPLLTFPDVEILHHRLVAAGMVDAVGYLKYICKAYEGALRIRRDLTMRAEPAKEPVKLIA